MAKPIRAKVTMRALLQRINRKLSLEGKVLRTCRGKNQRDLGEYFITTEKGFISKVKVDPDAYGREIGVLEPWEEVSE